MYTRGQFAVMGNIGRKALRLYHEEGLLVPVYTNEENGYHYYDEKQLAVLEKIKRFRKIGLSLFEIRQILDGKAEEAEIIESRISETDRLLKELKDYKTEKDPQQTEVIADEIAVRPFERCVCIYVCENVERENLGMSVGKLYERAARENLQIAGAHFALFSDLDDEEKFSMRTCLPVLNYAGTDAIEIYEEKCVHMHFTGGFSKIRQAHQSLRRYAEENGIDLTERVYEVYNNDMSADVYYAMK
ncbi:MAG: MerR family transcriptional regulator [Lachnospiraceae bacterium]|nr:MerR family transcriptional regulator [Lachnospiraceae bacterium]MBR3735147.1 MerR family transcriptional regulator [Lachnospiraceae bacterium]